MNTKVRGCLVVLAGGVAIYILLAAVRSKAPSESESPPLPTLTAEQTAGRLERQRQLAEKVVVVSRIAARQAAEAEANRAAKEAAWLKSPAGEIWREHQDWLREDCKLIAWGSVRLGFTEEQCRAAWGTPDDTRRSILPGHTTTLLCYGDFCRRSLLFTDDRLMRINQ